MLRIRVLGGFELCEGETASAVPNAPAVRTLLAFLIVHRGVAHSRQRVAFALYPDATEAQALTNLRKLLHRLRAAWPSIDEYADLGVATLAWRASHLQCMIDVTEFEDALHAGDAQRAVDVYRGELLPDELGEWVVIERERLRTAHLLALNTLCETLATSDPTRALTYCTRLVQAEPLREDTHRRLFRLYAAAVDPAGVRRAYQQCEMLLRDELGIAPSQITQNAFAEALRLAEVGAPELHEPRFAPVFATPFLGRADALHALANLLADPANRLITIHAPGGMGKTRLLYETLRRAPLESIWITFDDIHDAKLALARIAESIGLSPGATDDIGATVHARLRDASLLLGLDNLETVLDIAAELAALLKACPHVRVVATSRAPLNITWERIFELGVMDGDSAALFRHAAGRVAPSVHFDADAAAWIDRICALIGGMPLAIELAATSVRELPLEVIHDEIARSTRFLASPFHDVNARQRSVHEVLAWSWNRLPHDDGAAMRLLSVFCGGFDVDMAASLLALPRVFCARLLRRLTACMLLTCVDAR